MRAHIQSNPYILIHTFIPSEYLPVGLTNVTTQICMQTISKVNDMQEQVQMCVLLFFPKICVGCVCFFTNHRMDAKPAVFAFVDSVSAMPGFPASGVSVCVCVRARGGEVVSSVQSVKVGFLIYLCVCHRRYSVPQRIAPSSTAAGKPTRI